MALVYPPVTDTGWVTEEVRTFVDASPDHVHIVDPAEVAEVIGWLCTDAAQLVTGNVVRLRWCPYRDWDARYAPIC